FLDVLALGFEGVGLLGCDRRDILAVGLEGNRELVEIDGDDLALADAAWPLVLLGVAADADADERVAVGLEKDRRADLEDAVPERIVALLARGVNDLGVRVDLDDEFLAVGGESQRTLVRIDLLDDRLL